MPIITKHEPSPSPEGEGQAEGACVHCGGKLEPCGCRLIDGSPCQPPFQGWRHKDTGSHFCALPAPGTRVAESE